MLIPTHRPSRPNPISTLPGHFFRKHYRDWLPSAVSAVGSSKTTVAEALADHVDAPPGAVESDRICKAMHGVPADTRLPDIAYRLEVSERVHREMAWRAGLILAEGGSVVADAVLTGPLIAIGSRGGE